MDRIDPVIEWNRIFIDTLIATNPPNITGPRLGAIVQAAVFDAYNGIDQRYAPLFVTRRAPDGASREAAVVAAAYTTLVGLFPSQQAAVLDPALWRIDRGTPRALSDRTPAERPLRDAHPGWHRLGRRRRARDPGHARHRRFQRQLPGLRRRHGHRSVAADAAGVRTDERPEPGVHRHVRPGEQHPVPAGATADARQQGLQRRCQCGEGARSPDRLDAHRRSDRARSLLGRECQRPLEPGGEPDGAEAGTCRCRSARGSSRR